MKQLMATSDRRPPFRHCVWAMSFCAVHVFTFQCTAAANSPAPEHPSAKQVIAAWMGRQERIRSAKVVWIQDRVDKKGSISARSSTKLPAPIPAEDTEYSNTETLQLADDKWRLDLRGFRWNLDLGTLIKVKQSSVWADGTSKQFNDSNKLWGYIAGKENPVLELGLVHMWPIVWFLRPFAREQFRFFRCSADDLKVLGPEAASGPGANDLVVCGTRRPRFHALRLWLDPTREFVVVRVELGVTQLCIEYMDDAEYGLFPKQWSAVETSANSEERRVIACRVTDFELNQRIPPSVFDLRFPPGTRVEDENNRQLIVNSSGEFVAASPMDAQVGSRLRYSWFIPLNGIVVLCVLTAIVARYCHALYTGR